MARIVMAPFYLATILIIASLLFVPTLYREKDQMNTPAQDAITESEEPELFGPYAVDRVVDGDTIYIVNDAGESEKIRFIGVDTPESVHADPSKNTEEGSIASDYTKQLLTDKEVLLEYDADTTDQYGRTLAYVYLLEDDELVMVQDLLLSNGYARLMTIQPNSAYAAHFAELQKEARTAERGFWGDYSSLFLGFSKD